MPSGWLPYALLSTERWKLLLHSLETALTCDLFDQKEHNVFSLAFKRIGHVYFLFVGLLLWKELATM